MVWTTWANWLVKFVEWRANQWIKPITELLQKCSNFMSLFQLLIQAFKGKLILVTLSLSWKSLPNISKSHSKFTPSKMVKILFKEITWSLIVLETICQGQLFTFSFMMNMYLLLIALKVTFETLEDSAQAVVICSRLHITEDVEIKSRPASNVLDQFKTILKTFVTPFSRFIVHPVMKSLTWNVTLASFILIVNNVIPGISYMRVRSVLSAKSVPLWCSWTLKTPRLQHFKIIRARNLSRIVPNVMSL